MFKIRSFFRNLRSKISNIIFKFYRSTFKATGKVLILFTLITIIILGGLLIKYFTDDTWKYFLGTLAGLVSTILIGSLAHLIALGFEDRNKVNKDYKELTEKYKYKEKKSIINNKEVVTNSDDNYEQEVTFFDNSKVKFLYKSNFARADKIVIKDSNKKMYVPTDVMSSNYVTLFKAHRGSYKENGFTVRTDDFNFDYDNNILNINTSRSTYFNHLISNRVLDYPFEKSLTLRKIYEPGPVLTPLKNSVFSNHLGIIGIMKTKDDYYIINQRSKSGSTSKKLMVSPVAFGLSATIKETVDESYILKTMIEKINLRTDVEKLDDDKYIDQIINVGYGRDIYEGGKPHLFYLIKLNINKDEYLKLFKNNKCPKKMIDYDKRTFAIKPSEIKYKNNFFHITHHDEKGKTKKYLLDAEINLIMNIKCLMEHEMFK